MYLQRYDIGSPSRNYCRKLFSLCLFDFDISLKKIIDEIIKIYFVRLCDLIISSPVATHGHFS
jgi:hypothetical protein